MTNRILLGASALSLAIVGVACLTPRANADTTQSVTAQFSVTVPYAVGITVTQPTAITGLKASSVGTTTSSISTTNNTGKTGTVTVKDADTNTNLATSDGSYTIPTSSKVAAGTSSWGISTDSGSTYKAMPASNGTAATVGNDGAATTGSYTVTYGVGVSSVQRAGTYSDTIQFTMTADTSN